MVNMQVRNGLGLEYAFIRAAQDALGILCETRVDAKKAESYRKYSGMPYHFLSEMVYIILDNEQLKPPYVISSMVDYDTPADIFINDVGVSLKHNHNALKHNRVSPSINIRQWYDGRAASVKYYGVMKFLFDSVSPYKKWSEIDKSYFYNRVLTEVKKEIDRWNIPPNDTRIARYFLGQRDYYKVVYKPQKAEVVYTVFNMYGTLKTKSHINLSAFKQADITRWNTLTLNFRDYDINLRIHNASSRIESSLKFDVSLIS